MKHSLFLAKILNLDKYNEYFILVREDKALVRGIFIEACFNEKEMLK